MSWTAKKYLSEISRSQIHVTITGQPNNCPNYPNGPIQSLTRVQSGPEQSYGFVDLKFQKGTFFWDTLYICIWSKKRDVADAGPQLTSFWVQKCDVRFDMILWMWCDAVRGCLVECCSVLKKSSEFNFQLLWSHLDCDFCVCSSADLGNEDSLGISKPTNLFNIEEN